MSRGVVKFTRVHVFYTEALAEFQHVNCMIVQILELHAILGLKVLLRRLPQW